MSTVSLKNASLSGAVKYNSLLAGNPATEIPAPTDYDLLQTTILGSSQSSVEFTGLGSYTDYKHLQIRHVSRRDSSGGDSALVEFNGDTSTSYHSHLLFGAGVSVSSVSALNRSDLVWSLSQRSTGTTNAFAAGIIDLLDAFNSSKNTTMRSFSGAPDSGTLNQVRLASGLYANTAAITSVKLISSGGNFITGSRFSLYGIKAA